MVWGKAPAASRDKAHIVTVRGQRAIALITDMLKQTIVYVKCCTDWFVYLGVFLFIAFV